MAFSRGRALVLAVVLATLVLSSGCAYMKDRGHDALNIFDIGFTVTKQPHFGIYAGFNSILALGYMDMPDGWLLGLQSQWAIFDGRATTGRVAQARSVLEQTRLSLTQAQLAAEVEVRRSFSSWQEATELADASRKVVAQAEEAVRLATARYDAGTATQLDVLQSQVDLTTARTNQVQAYYNYNIAVATLRAAMGQSDAFVSN